MCHRYAPGLPSQRLNGGAIGKSIRNRWGDHAGV